MQYEERRLVVAAAVLESSQVAKSSEKLVHLDQAHAAKHHIKPSSQQLAATTKSVAEWRDEGPKDLVLSGAIL